MVRRLSLALGSGALLVLLGVALSGVRQQAALEQDGMAIGSGGMPLSLDADDGADKGSKQGGNPFLNALESSVDAAREVRQEMGGTSMRMSAGRAALRRLPAQERRTDTARATQTLKDYVAQRSKEDAEARDTLNNYIAQEMRSARDAQSTQLAAQAPELSGMSLGSGGRPLPMHLPEPVSWKQDPTQKAKMLALFDRLSPQTKQLLLDQQGDLAAAVEKVEKQMMTSRSSHAMRSRTEMLWNAQKTGPYNPMQRVSHFDAESSKVNKMIANWNSGADRAPAGSYTDY